MSSQDFQNQTFDLTVLGENDLKELLQKYKIGLTNDEAIKIQKEILKRPPTLTELILWSIEGSEHCSYKSSRPFLKQFVTSGPNVILGPSEDAGIVEVAKDKTGKKYGVVISHESHNSPSQIVPFEGAATGIGGNVRDVSCMGAKVIGVSDSLRFGELENHKSKWIAGGVVDGVAGYGNPIGVPNIGGDVYFDETYNNNCLVNVVTLGVLAEDEIIHSFAPKNAVGYDLILVGKPTDNSGFGGASFSSAEVKEEEKEANKGAVQEPNAFLKRHLLKATYTLFKELKSKNLLSKVGFKDLGAGGISCASVELADGAGYGAEIDLEKVPVGMEGLSPSVILCAETQERYMWVCHPDITSLILKNYNETFALSEVSRGAKASVVGKIRDDGQYIVRWMGLEIVKARACDVTSGILYDRQYEAPERHFAEPEIEYENNLIKHKTKTLTLEETLLSILSHENVASRVPIYEQYDKNVQGISVIEPGQADASVLQPFKYEEFPEEIRKTGIVFKVDHNPRYGKIDPYWCGVNSVVECLRNVASVGGSPQAMTDCLNFGNPEKPEQMWEFVESVRGVAETGKSFELKENPGSPIPIVSGNVSLYKESKGKPIAASPIISVVGRMDDVSKAVTQNFQKPNSKILLVGQRKDELGGSVFYQLFDELGANLPKPDIKELQKQIWTLTDVINDGLVLSCHDISDGGLATCLSEMTFGNEIGFEVELSNPSPLRGQPLIKGQELNNYPFQGVKIFDFGGLSGGGLSEEFTKSLFTETGGFVLESLEENLDEVKNSFQKVGLEIFEIGETKFEKTLNFKSENQNLKLDLLTAKNAWQNGLREKW